MGVKKKVLLLGDSAVGKTSLTRRFVFDIFEDAYIMTIGSKVSRKELRIETPNKTVDLTLMIWDVLGREGYTAFHARTFAGVHGALLVADLTRRETLHNLERYWIPSLFKVVENVPLVFVGNKADLKGEFEFQPSDLAEVADKHNGGLREALRPPLSTTVTTSAKTGENVEAAFESLGGLLLSGKTPHDPIKELYESLVAVGISRTADRKTPVGALDGIIVDFCEQAQDEFEDDRMAMTVLRQEVLRAGVDVRSPTREGIRKLVEYLAEAETEFKDGLTVAHNRERRLEWAIGAKK